MKNLALLLVVMSLLFIGCSDEKNAASTQSTMPKMPPLPAKAQIIKYEKVDFTKSYSAVLKPFKEVDIVARVRGILQIKNFTEGAFVKEGEIIYELEKDEYKAALDEAKAAFLKAEANFNKAANDWDRGKYLFKNSAISKQQRDELLYAFDDAKAEVQKAKAIAQKAELNYSYTTIKAPISGMIGMSNSDVGSYIDFDAQNANLATITSLQSIYAEFSVPSVDILKYKAQIKTGAEVTINLGAKKYIGIVDYIAPKLDLKTDTLLLRATFKNQNKELVVGSYVELSMDGFSYENVVKIPQNALIKTPEALMVYVVKNGEISMRAVEVLQVTDGLALVSRGLNEGESIVVSNIAKLRPKSKVAIMEGN
ncbi:MAG: efflux RND transporter periplasmic adaptor subunit [Sulfurimonas sp.]|nr:efflux RND transporter periplasmic adaptor subunit [Sulfurimonas sp.]